MLSMKFKIVIELDEALTAYLFLFIFEFKTRFFNYYFTKMSGSSYLIV